MATTAYSQRLGANADEQLQAALDRFSLGRLISATPVTRGMFGQNIFLTTTVGEFVLRGAPHDAEQLPRERFFCGQLHERTSVPVPWPYLIDDSPVIFGWTYAIMRRQPGIHIDDESRKALSMGDRLALAAAMGETVACLGDATWPHGGIFDAASGGIVAPASGMSESERWVRERIADAERYCPQTIAPDRIWLEATIARGAEALAVPYQASATTSDFGEGNSVAEKAAKGWRVSGVFDFHEYSMGDLELTLARPLLNYFGQDPELARAFVTAFTRTRPFRSGARQRMALYAIGDRFLFWNYGHSNAQWFPPELTFRAFAEPALEQLDSIIAAAS